MSSNTPLNEDARMIESQAFAALAQSLRELGFKLIAVEAAKVPDTATKPIGGFLWEKDGKRFFQNLDNKVEIR
jgi:crotonobetainyl-CoA:carnitine CoA-transferase CaiB-like acyl-CoA transferase